MALRTIIFIIGSLFLLTACKKAQEPVPVDVADSKAELLSKMIVQEKYWKLESVIVATGSDSILLTYDYQDPNNHNWWIGSWVSRFHSNSVLELINATPSSGEAPYGDQMLITYALGSYQPASGKWFWDDKLETVCIEETRNPIGGRRGYLDEKNGPVTRTVFDAFAYGKPERVRFIFLPEAGSVDQSTYIYCLRAAWILKNETIYFKSVRYRVLY